MSSLALLICFIAYTGLLFGITLLTSKGSSNKDFFNANKSSKWYVISYGMIGASLSGITFMSIPGWVGTTQFSYLMVVFGYMIGYFIIAYFLLPLYYRLNLTTIYSYLGQRFGNSSHQTGALFFILSRTIGAAFRLYLVVVVLQHFVLHDLGVSFELTLAIFIGLILAFTYKGGIKPVVWTDTLQTTFMLLAVGIGIYQIGQLLHENFFELVKRIHVNRLDEVVFYNWNDKRNWIKQLLSGIFICIAMTGLDQEMMQKNLSCKNLKEAQKNMLVFSFIVGIANLLFLFLGALLFSFCMANGIEIPSVSDQLFPTIAIHYLGPITGLTFVIGLISAAYPSADGALTSLTTSFCLDLIKINRLPDHHQLRRRKMVHLAFAGVLFVTILIFKQLNNKSVVETLFKAAGYTYGPLLGLFTMGIFSKRSLNDRWTPLVCIIAPIITFTMNYYSPIWFGGFDFGFLILPLNGFITLVGLFLISHKPNELCVE